MIAFCLIFVIFPIELAKATSTVHFYCTAISKGNYGSITFAGTTYQSGQSASYSESDYWITGNPPSPTTDWFFYHWSVMWLGTRSWVDNENAQSTLFHLRGEAYLWAYFYSPIHANNPTSPITWGAKQRITGTAVQYSGHQLTVVYYPQGSGMGPPNPNGVPPFGGSGYYWTTVTVSSGSWDTGLIYPTLPISLGQQLPQTYDVYACFSSGGIDEVDSNVVSFTLNPASAQIAAPTLTPSDIELGQSVTITDQIFSSAYVNSNDLTGTLTVQAKKQGEGSWTEVASQSFTSSYGYSSVYGQYGVFYDLSKPWTPAETGTYDVRVVYSGNNYYSPIDNPPTSMLTVSQAAVDLGVLPQLQHKDTRMLCLRGCDLTGDHAWDSAHQNVGCDHDFMYCAMASISMINSYYGGHLSQDRIMYYVMRELNHNSIPEGDLGHGRGTQALDEIRDALSWALNDVSIEYQSSKPTFAQIKGWIDSGRPILRRHLVGSSGHATVIDGYEDTGEMAHMIDPGIGAENSLPYSTLDVNQVWVPPASATARSDEISLGLDTDADGIVDFDEIFRFGTNPNNPDTDGDLVYDKQEIISYTFLSDGSFDVLNLRWPDSDFDGLRCERDIDSDNGGTLDGLEDLNGNGIVDPGEMDPLNPLDDLLRAAWVRIFGRSPINLLVTDPNSRRVGYDPETQSVVNEIPGATYSGPSSEPQEIVIPNSLNGTYIVEAIGTDTGPYTITLESLDSNSSIIDSDTWQGMATPGEQYSESLSLEPDGRLMLAHDIEVTNLLPSKTIVGQNYSVIIKVPIENQGNNTETFNVTIYANTTIIATITNITLSSGNSTTITFLWNTTGVPYGNYTITATVTPVPGEIDTTDNTYIYGIIKVTIPGDLNGDRFVDSTDQDILGMAWGSTIGEPNYIPEADLNGDGVVDSTDYGILGVNWGHSWS